jgi:hypothetical protein
VGWQVHGRVPVLCWRSQHTGSLLLRAADIVRTPTAPGEPARATTGASAAYIALLVKARDPTPPNTRTDRTHSSIPT